MWGSARIGPLSLLLYLYSSLVLIKTVGPSNCAWKEPTLVIVQEVAFGCLPGVIYCVISL